MLPESVRSELKTLEEQAWHSLPSFNALIAPTPLCIAAEVCDGFHERYAIIVDFQRQVSDLALRALQGDAPPIVTEVLLADLPPAYQSDYHRRILSARQTTPLFFRTDEATPGVIVEIQAPGSLWGEYTLLRDRLNESRTDASVDSVTGDLVATTVSGLVARYGKHPHVHHLLDNASRPFGMLYFVLRTQAAACRYFGLDPDVKADDCQLIRSHSFPGILGDNFARPRLAAYCSGELDYDLPPTALFDNKAATILPFHPDTRACFADCHRALFPFTSLLKPDGVFLESGVSLSLKEFAQLPRSQRGYFLKYAGNDTSRNWGSRTVYELGHEDKADCLERLQAAALDCRAGGVWLLQQAISSRGSTPVLRPEGTRVLANAHMKWSAFYGPQGLMGVLCMYRKFYKVHGKTDTVFRLVERQSKT